MIKGIAPLDGNAAAGQLSQFLAFDATMLVVICGGCALEGPLAELQLYGRGASIMLRCRRCGAVNIRMLETKKSVNLDLNGSARLSIQKRVGPL